MDRFNRLEQLDAAIRQAEFDLAIEHIDHLMESIDGVSYKLMNLKGACYERLGQYELALETFEKTKQIIEESRQPFDRWALEPFEADAYNIIHSHIPYILLHLGRNEEAADLLRDRSSATWPCYAPLIFRLIENKLKTQNFDPHFASIEKEQVRFLPQWVLTALEDHPQEALGLIEKVQPNRHDEYYTQQELDFSKALIHALNGDFQPLKEIQSKEMLSDLKLLLDPFSEAIHYIIQ